jgi:hypothetical protein
VTFGFVERRIQVARQHLGRFQSTSLGVAALRGTRDDGWNEGWSLKQRATCGLDSRCSLGFVPP